MRKWTPEEIRILKDYRYGNGVKIARKLGRSPPSVWHKANRLGLRGRKRKLDIKKCSDLFYVFGVLHGDGYVHKTKRNNYKVGLSVTSKTFALEFAQVLRSFGLNVFHSIEIEKPRKIGDKLIKNPKPRHRVFVNCKALYRWYKETSLSELENYLRGKKDYAIAFIKGFYESDGSLVEKHIKNHTYYLIQIGVKNKKLIDFVARLIENLGLTVCRCTNKANIHFLSLYRQNEIDRFLDLINPCIKTKKVLK